MFIQNHYNSIYGIPVISDKSNGSYNLGKKWSDIFVCIVKNIASASFSFRQVSVSFLARYCAPRLIISVLVNELSLIFKIVFLLIWLHLLMTILAFSKPNLKKFCPTYVTVYKTIKCILIKNLIKPFKQATWLFFLKQKITRLLNSHVRLFKPSSSWLEKLSRV